MTPPTSVPPAPLRQISWYANSLEEYVQKCKEKIAVTERLCVCVGRYAFGLANGTSEGPYRLDAENLAKALRDYLCFELDIAANPAPQEQIVTVTPPAYPAYKVTAEEFENAQRQVEAAQAQVDAITAQIDDAPEDAAPALVWALKSGLLMFQQPLAQAIARRDALQAMMEKQGE